jgi:cellulose biosynthesis protein BcsQ
MMTGDTSQFHHTKAQRSVISSENRAGGQGKTTAVILLATALAHDHPNHDFLIINTDPQNDCTLQLGIDGAVGDRCLSQFVMGNRPISEVIVPANSVSGMKRKNLYYSPAGPRFAAEVERMQEDYGIMRDMYERLSEAARRRQPPPVSPSQQFLDALMPLKKRGPNVIFIDCPPSLGPLRQMVHWLADYVVVPVVPGAKEVGMTMRHTRDLSEDIEAGAKAKILAIVPNQFDTRLSLHREFLQQLYQVYNRFSGNLSHIARPLDRRRPIIQIGPKSSVILLRQLILEQCVRRAPAKRRSGDKSRRQSILMRPWLMM